MFPRTSTTRRVATMLFLALAGCQPSVEDVRHWKNTERGPGKIRRALQDASTPLPVRTEAVLALGELGMAEELGEDLKMVAVEPRTELLRAAIPGLVKMSQGDDPAAPATKAMRNGKDALFYVRPFCSKEDGAMVDRALVAWVVADLTTRMGAGLVGGEKVLATAGPFAAGPALAKLVTTAGPTRAKAAELLGTFGDAKSRDLAVRDLIASTGKAAPTEELLRTIGLVGGGAAETYLKETAQKGPLETRAVALRALTGPPSPEMLDFAIELARDRSQPGTLREDAFGLIEKGKGVETARKVLPLLEDSDKTVARRAIEAALHVGETSAIPLVLERIPLRLFDERADLQDFLLRYLVRLGPSAIPSLKLELGSKSPLARLAAVLALGQLGATGDVQAIEKLQGDSTRLPIRGLAAGGTVGAEARAAVEKLKKKD